VAGVRVGTTAAGARAGTTAVAARVVTAVVAARVVTAVVATRAVTAVVAAPTAATDTSVLGLGSHKTSQGRQESLSFAGLYSG
jgi:hypothetical protein